MPKAKQKSASASSQQDADEEPYTQTQTATQAQRAASSIPAEELQTKVNDLVQYIMVMDQKKIPIKRVDMNKNVLKEHSKAFSVVMGKAKEKLAQVFGLELVELEGKQQKSYILVNSHELDAAEPHLTHSETDNQRTGLLMVILSTIFMSNNVIIDNQLYAMLKNLGVDIERQHAVFGDVKKLLTQEFVRQGYLEMSRQPTSEPPSYEFRWGQRAKHELSKRKCLQFVTKVYGMQDPSQWTSQWADVQQTDGETNGEELEVMDEDDEDDSS